MSLSAEALYRMSDVELLAAYIEARRQFVEKKFTRDTHRARLAWIKAKMFIGGSGGVTERNMVIDVSEEIARKGQELREMTRDLDLLKVDVDIIATVIRLRGASIHRASTYAGDATFDPARPSGRMGLEHVMTRAAQRIALTRSGASAVQAVAALRPH